MSRLISLFSLLVLSFPLIGCDAGDINFRSPEAKKPQKTVEKSQEQQTLQGIIEQKIAEISKLLERRPTEKDPLVQLVDANSVRKAKLQYQRNLFSSTLEKEYMQLSKRLSLQKNWTDATYFRRKAFIAIDSALDILPEDPLSYNIEDDVINNNLLDTRLALIKSLNDKTIAMSPVAAAKAIAFHDCNIVQKYMGWVNDFADCEKAFEDSFAYLRESADRVEKLTMVELLDNYQLADVEQKYWPVGDFEEEKQQYEGDYAIAVKNALKEKLEREEKKKQEQLELANKRALQSKQNFIVDEEDTNATEVLYLIYYDGNSNDANPTALQEIKNAADQIKLNKPKSVIINGHTDRSFSNLEALVLSKKRADNVKKELIAQGVNADIIRTFGFGKSDNQAPNEEGVKEPKNNRAEVIFRVKTN